MFLKDGAWSAWNNGECSAKCGGGKRTSIRYCYSPLPCLGKSSKIRKCNTDGCPGQSRIYLNFSFFRDNKVKSSRGLAVTHSIKTNMILGSRHTASHW